MYCKECGVRYENEHAEYCLSCGVKKGSSDNFCCNCGTKKINSNQDICLTCGIEFKKNTSNNINKISNASEKSRLVTLILWFFLGGIGVHQYYVGQSGKGTMILVLTLCGFITLRITTFISGIILIIDLISILSGTFKDSDNKLVLNWS